MSVVCCLLVSGVYLSVYLSAGQANLRVMLSDLEKAGELLVNIEEEADEPRCVYFITAAANAAT